MRWNQLWVTLPWLLAACVADVDPASNPGALGGTSPKGEDPPFEPGEDCIDDEGMNTFGLCLCDSFDLRGDLQVERAHPSMPASVGVNGTTDLSGYIQVDGDWIGHAGIVADAESLITGRVVTTGNFSWQGDHRIGGDLDVGGDLMGKGVLEVAGAVGVGGDHSVKGISSFGSERDYRAPSGLPCGCESDALFDVAEAVALAKNDNDNVLIGLSPEGEVSVGANELSLPSGRYYLSDFAHVDERRLVIDGIVTLYVDGDIGAVVEDQIQIAAEGSLDLYVAGSVRVVERLGAANAEAASQFRLMIGGDEGLLLAMGEQELFAHIYAPTVDVELMGETTIVGSLLARRIDGLGDLEVVHSSAEMPPPENCSGEEGPR